MARSPFQSDFVIERKAPDPVELPDSADAVMLPPATLRSPEASSRATRIVMTITFITIGLLVLICMIGPHIPSGE